MKFTYQDKVYIVDLDVLPYNSADDIDVYEVNADGKVVMGSYDADAKKITMDGPPTALVSEYSVKGFVGANGNGNMTVSSAALGLSFDVKITDGQYSVRLPGASDWCFDYTVTSGDVKYSETVNDITVDKDCRINLVTSGAVQMLPADGVVVNSHGIMKEVSFTIPAETIHNDSDKGSIFKFTYGSGWSQIGFEYEGSDVSEIYVPARADKDTPGTNASEVKVHGWYNSTVYDINEDLMITVEGSQKYFVLFNDSAATVPSADEKLVYVNKTSDTIGDFQYSYNFAVNNQSGKGLNGSFIVEPGDGWRVTVTVTAGSLIKTMTMPEDHKFTFGVLP